MRTLLHRFNSTRIPLRSHTQSQKRRGKLRNQLRFERLENRITLDAQAVHWDGGGNDLLWNNPLNWSNDSLPGPTADVTIDIADNITVTSVSNVSIRSLTSQDSLNIVAGIFAIESQSTIGGKLSLSNATLVANAGIEVAGQFIWHNGILSGADGHGSLIVNGGTQITGSETHSLQSGFRFVNPLSRTVAWSLGRVRLGDHSYFDNYGSIDQQGDMPMDSLDELSEFNNFGTFTKSAGTGNTPFGSWLAVGMINNSGTITANVGTLSLGYFGTSQTNNSGTIKGLADTRLNLFGIVTGAGTINADWVQFSNGTATLSGPFQVNKTDVFSATTLTGNIQKLGNLTVVATLNLTDATLASAATTLDSLSLDGTLTTDESLSVSGQFTWHNGTLRGANGTGSLIANGGTQITGSETHSLQSGFRFVNPLSRTVLWSLGRVRLGDHSYFDNYGSIDQQGDMPMDSLDELSEFNNFGTFTKSAGTGNTPFGSWLAVGMINNSGTITANVGTLSLGYFGTSQTNNSGTIKGLADTRLNLFGIVTGAGTINADWVQFSNGTATLSGPFQVNKTDVFSATTLSGNIQKLGNLTVVATLNLTDATLASAATTLDSLSLDGTLTTDESLSVSGQFTWHNGTLRGANGTGSLIANGGTQITGSETHSLQSGFRFVNPLSRTVAWSLGRVRLGDHSYFDNYGSIDQQGDMPLDSLDELSEFNNFGTFTKSAGTGNTPFGSWLAVGMINNSGTITANVGTLSLGYFGTSQTNNSGTIKGIADTRLNLLGIQTGAGTINADWVQFSNGTATLSGPFQANKTEVYSETTLTGTIQKLGNLTVVATLNLTDATLASAATTLDSLSLDGTLTTDESLSVSGQFTWHNGTLRGANGTGSLIANGGTQITGSETHSLQSGFRFVNPLSRTVAWSLGRVRLGDHSYFDNYGSIDQQGDMPLDSLDELSEFNNFGTFTKSAGTGNTPFGSWLAVGMINNSGTIAANVGALSLGYFGTSQTNNSGTIKGLANTRLNLFGIQTGAGAINADWVQFSNGTVSLSGPFQANKTEVYSETTLTGTIQKLGNLTVVATLNLTNATLTSAATTLDSLSLDGTLTTDESLSVSGQFTWHNGTLRGANGTGSLIVNGGTQITGSETHSLQSGFRFVNPLSRTVLWSLGRVRLGDHSYFDNYGSIDQQGDMPMDSLDELSEFNNFGTFTKSAGTGNTPFGSWLAVGMINNSGTITANVGTLSLGYFGTSQTNNSGTIKGIADTRLNLLGIQTGAGTINADWVQFSNGTATLSGPFQANKTEVYSETTLTGTIQKLGNLTVVATLNLTDATLASAATTLDSLSLDGTLTTDESLSVSGQFTWHNGTLRGANGTGSLIANGGTQITGSETHSLQSGFRFVNPLSRTVAWSLGRVRLGDHSYFDNYGSIDQQGDMPLDSLDELSEFNNFGTFTKSAGTGNTPFGSWLAVGMINNSGTITANVGTLSLGYFGTSQTNNSGTIKGLADTRLNLLGIQTGAGTINADWVQFSNGTATLSGPFQANKTEVYSETTLTGTIQKLGNLTVFATLNLTDGSFASGATTLDSLSLDGTLTTDESLSVSGQFTWHNGTLRGANGSGSLRMPASTIVAQVLNVRDFTLINSANLMWSGGTVQFFGNGSGFVNTSGATFEDQIDGSFGSVDGYCVRFQNDGHFIKSGLTGITYLQMQLYNRGSVEIQQGRLFLGCGYVSDSPSNPPAPGIEYPVDHPPVYEDPNPRPLPPTEPVVVPGTYTQTVTGLLIEQIAGHSGAGPYGIPGTDYGQLVVNGDVALDGAFQVQVIGGFVPTVGQQYLVIDNRGTKPIAGKFIGLPEGEIVWAGNYGFVISYVGGNGNDVVLTMDRFANSPPVADAGGPYEVAEGGSIALSAANSRDAQQPTASLVFAWDLDGDGIFGEVGSSAARGNENVINPTFSALGLDGPSTYPVNLRVTDEFGAMATASAMINVFNVAPRVTLTGPTSATEGSTRNYLFANSDPGIDTFEIVATSGGAFGIVSNILFDSATGVGSFDVKFTDGPANSVVTIQLRDSDGVLSNTSTIPVAVTNVAPAIATIASSNVDLAHVSTTGNVNLSGTYFDPALGFDTHTVRVNWGDGSPVETLPASSVNQTLDAFQRNHHYANGGIYTISVTVLDEDGGVSATTTSTAVVYGLGLVNGTLYIIGTEGNDEVELEYSPNTNLLTVEIELDEDSGCDDEVEVTKTYNASTITRIVSWLLGGDDEYESDDDVSLPQIVFGGAGDDEIKGGSGNDALMGGSGNDEIKGGLGRDLLIGGIGRDNLKGQSGDDVLVGGSVTNQDSLAAIDQALASWSIGNLNATLLYLGSIMDDLEKDELSGDAGSDQLFGGLGDKLKQ